MIWIEGDLQVGTDEPDIDYSPAAPGGYVREDGLCDAEDREEVGVESLLHQAERCLHDGACANTASVAYGPHESASAQVDADVKVDEVGHAIVDDGKRGQPDELSRAWPVDVEGEVVVAIKRLGGDRSAIPRRLGITLDRQTGLDHRNLRPR